MFTVLLCGKKSVWDRQDGNRGNRNLSVRSHSQVLLPDVPAASYAVQDPQYMAASVANRAAKRTH
jgi:hypothetical protein